MIGRGRQIQFFSSKAANAFSVHRKARRARRRYHSPAFLFELDECLRGDRFYFRDDECRLFLFYHFADLFTFEHRKYIRTMCYLHRRRVLVPVARDDLAPEPHCFYRHFFPELTRAQEEYLYRRRFKGSPESHTVHYLMLAQAREALLLHRRDGGDWRRWRGSRRSS